MGCKPSGGLADTAYHGRKKMTSRINRTEAHDDRGSSLEPESQPHEGNIMVRTVARFGLLGTIMTASVTAGLFVALVISGAAPIAGFGHGVSAIAQTIVIDAQ